MRPALLTVATALCVTAAHATPTALERANQNVADLWQSDVLPRLRTQLDQAVRAQVGKVQGGNRATLEVRGVRRVALRAPAPGFTHLDDHRIELRLPRQGSWELEVEADLRFRYRGWGPFKFKKDLRLTVLLRDLVASARVDLDATDPLRPTLLQAHRPQVDFELRVRSDAWYVNLLLGLLRRPAQRWAERAVDDALARLDPVLSNLGQLPQPVGTGGPAVTATAARRITLPDAAERIQALIRAEHVRYGSLVSLVYDRAAPGTWEDTLLDPAFQPGNRVSYTKLKDSAIWSGHYLAALAFRYAQTQDPATLRDAEGLVAAFDTMLRVRGTPGLLNRALQPASMNPTQQIGGETYLNRYQGVDYVCYDTVSRDQYAGMFFGLAAAYDFMPPLRGSAGATARLALDYLLRSGWITRRRNGELNTTWAQSWTAQLAYVRLGARIDPARYGATLQDYLPLAELAWIGPWTSAFDPLTKYYKWNLSHVVLHTALRQESDPGRYLALLRGMRLQRAAIGHHHNAHFDVLYAAAEPGLASGYRDEVTSLLRQWLTRSRRVVAVTNSADPTLATVFYTPALGSALGGAPGVPANGRDVALYPLPVARRIHNEFVWQISPYKLDESGDGTRQDPGVDLLLPYWMARYYRVLP